MVCVVELYDDGSPLYFIIEKNHQRWIKQSFKLKCTLPEKVCQPIKKIRHVSSFGNVLEAYTAPPENQ